MHEALDHIETAHDESEEEEGEYKVSDTTGGGQALPRPLPRALRAEMNLIRTLNSYWRAALLGGVWEGLALPRKSIVFW